MNNEIRIIRREQEQVSQPKLQNTKRTIISQNSPILRQIKEVEEKYKIRKALSDDELIELEFKEEADKIRQAKKEENIISQTDIKLDKNQPSCTGMESVDENITSNIETKNKNIKELPINDANLAYIMDLDEPVSSNNTQNKSKESENKKEFMSSRDTLHREPLKPINRFSDVITKNNPPSKLTAINSDLLNKQISNPFSNDSSSLIERLKIDRQKIYESKREEIIRVESARSFKKDDDFIQSNKNNFRADFIANNNTKKNDDIKNRDNNFVDNTNRANLNLSSLESVAEDFHHNLVQDENKTLHNENQGVYVLPHTGLLNQPRYQKNDINDIDIDLKATKLIDKLRFHKINGDITDIYSGPVITTLEFRPAPDVKVSKIQNLQDDLKMTLKVENIRIQAPIPGKDVVGIETPNNTIQTIYIREIFESNEFVNSNAMLSIVLGKDVIGRPVICDLARLPHLLIAGTTGSGKSVGLNGMILSLLYKNTPEQLRFIMIDPKRVELSLYNDIPHLLTPIISDPKKAVFALSKAVDEMNKRYDLMNEVGVKNIIGYNEVAAQKGFDKLPYIVIIIDEFADLMIMGGKDSEQYLTSLASKARASGIHLIIATQRPTVNVVTGLIKSNLPSRVSYRVGTATDSRVIIDRVGAETLLGNGDLLFLDKNTIYRYHAPYSSEKEIERVADFIRAQQSVEYDDFFSLDAKEILQNTTSVAFPISEDEYMQKAREIILESRRTSASYLQRALGIGFNRASNILETLEREGFLSPPNSRNIREIIGNHKSI